MRILVTGANGFVGRKLVSVLADQGHTVRGLDLITDGLDARGADSTIAGDFGNAALRKRALAECEAVIHLATVPGGAAEKDPAEGRRINVDATMAFADEFAAMVPGGLFVAASSIGVIGQPFPPKVDDAAPVTPYMYYGAHKAMMEIWLSTLARRGELAALSIRLPGIVARPAGSERMKSAFMSNVFHALAARQKVAMPVKPAATLWLMSLERIAANFVHALDAAGSENMPENRAVTLPAVQVTIEELVVEIARQTGADPSLVTYEVDAAIQEGFGQQPPLQTPAAEQLGFQHDGDVAGLVSAALRTLNV